MKRIICIFLICIYVFSLAVTAYASTSETDESMFIEHSTLLTTIPQTSSFQQVSSTFFISNGVAYITFSASAIPKNIKANILIEKKVLGIFWQDVGNDVFSSGNKNYITGDYSVNVDSFGEYRATIIFNVNREQMTKIINFSYNSNEKIIGDTDGNGKIQAIDARLTLRFAAMIQKYTAEQFDRADVNRDGRITATDARTILRCAAKL